MLHKESSIKAKSLKDLTRIIEETASSKSKQLKGNVSAKTMAEKLVKGDGTGSVFLSPTKALLNKLSGSKRLGDKTFKGYSKLQSSLADIDIKAGSKIDKALSQNKVTKPLSKAFITKQQVPLSKSVDGVADEIFEVSVPTLSAPLGKTRDFVVPTAGTLYLSTALAKKPSKEKKEGGSDMGNINQFSDSDRAEELREKISSALGINRGTIDKSGSNNQVNLMKQASYALKIAAKERDSMIEDLVKIAEENKTLQKELLFNKKKEEVNDLVNEMFRKGMITKLDIDNKVNEFLDMSDEGLAAIKKTTKEYIPSEKTASFEGVDNLTFLGCEDNISVNKRHSFADSFSGKNSY